MKRLRSLSLGTKLNLSLLAFLLLLGVATLAIMVYGFSRTRDNANERSDEALEEGGRLALQAVAGGAGEQGGLLFEAVAEVGRRSALFLEEPAAAATQRSQPAPSLAPDASGNYADTAPDRVTDVVVISGGLPPSDVRVIDDIALSAPLDTIFPVLLRSFAGEVGGSNLDPIAISFISVNGVARYYPPARTHDLDIGAGEVREQLAAIGPDQNPERETIWTAPYDAGDGRGLIVTARTPVYDGTTLRGAIDVDVSMGSVFGQIDRIRPTPGAFAFYVDRDGTLLEGRSFPLLNTELTTNPELAQVLEAMRSIPPGDTATTDARVKLEGDDYFIAYNTVPGLGGTFAVAAPVSDLTAATASISSGIEDEGARTLQLTLAAMAVLFAAGLAGAAMLNRTAVIKPINRLVVAARAVGGGDLDARVPVSGSRDEFGELGLTFNSMVEQLRESERTLEGRVEQRTRELTTLLEVSRQIASELSLDELVQTLVRGANELFDTTGATIASVDEEGNATFLGSNHPELAAIAVGMRYSLSEAGAIWDELRQGRGVLMGNVRGDDAFAASYQHWMGPALDDVYRDVRSWMGVPFHVRGRLIGWMAVSHSEPNRFEASDLRIAMAMGSQAAVAFENARLYEEAIQRTNELNTLLVADSELHRSLSLDTVLEALVDVMMHSLKADKCIVTMRAQESDHLVIRAQRNFSSASIGRFNELYVQQKTRSESTVVRGVITHEDTSRMEPAVRSILESEGVHSTLDAPIFTPDGLAGGFDLGYTSPHVFTSDELRLAQAIAERAGVAIRNAELYRQAQRAGSLEERQRLARELHDSVSQALYGIALGTRTARLRLGEDPQNAAEPIDYVASLAQAGLAEMRALIFELRPESFEQEGLTAAIEKQAASTRARYGLDVRVELMDEPECSIEAKEALYRIAQEALHNVVKHAEAQQANISLHEDDGSLVLAITDDGRGFDTSASFPGHVGLQSMSERCARLGGALAIESAARGTRIVARLPLPSA